MTAALDRVPVDDITERAKQVDVGRALLTALAAVFYVLGWIPAKACLAVVWACLAIKVGWQAAWNSSKNRPDPTE